MVIKSIGKFLLVALLGLVTVSQPVWAQKSVSFTISGHVPVKCNITLASLLPGEIRSGDAIGIVNQDCNTPHIINIAYDSSLLPVAQNIILEYAGKQVPLTTAGQVTLAEDGPFRGEREIHLQTSGEDPNLQSLISSFTLEFTTL